MSVDWRAGAFAAGAAFILSLLAGLFGGVSFGALVFRAIIGAVIFGAGAMGVSLLVDRYLPELKTSAGNDTPAGAPEDRPGGRVDITVDDSMDADVDSSFALEGESEEFESGIAAEEVHAEPDIAEAELVDEDEDEDEDEEEVADLEEADESDEERDSDRSVGESVPEAGSAQSLPDIEGFSGSFAEVPAEAEELDGAQRSGEDPSIMARAIRTVLKREE